MIQDKSMQSERRPYSVNTFYEQRPEQLFVGDMTDHVFPAHVHSVAELVVLTCGSAVMTIDETSVTVPTVMPPSFRL